MGATHRLYIFGATCSCSGLSLLVGSVRCLYFLWVNTATLSMDRAMAWVESLDIFEDVVGGYIIRASV